MICFELFGISVCFKFGFFATVALFCLLDAPELAAVSAAACAVHELGHVFVLVFLGIPIKSIVFWAGGVRMTAGKGVTPSGQDTAVLLAGPYFNFLAALLLWKLGSDSGAAVNAVLGLFNLMPFSELDGGAVLRLQLESRMINPGAVMKAAAVCTTAVLCGYFIVSGTGNVTLYLTLGILAVSEFFAS